jgi:ATP-dependent Clp protease adaptor protein ClpS
MRSSRIGLAGLAEKGWSGDFSRAQVLSAVIGSTLAAVPARRTKIRFAPGAESAKVSGVADSHTHTSPAPDTATELALGSLWRVVVLNDPVNLMSYVVLVFKKVFGFDDTKATKHMLEVHERGRSVVWTGPRENAEAYAYTLQQWHLTAVLESDETH